MATRIEVRGIKRVHKKLGMPAVKRLRDEIEDDVKDGTRRMAKESSRLAPIDTGALKISIIESVDKRGWAEYIYGSHLPYAQRKSMSITEMCMILHHVERSSVNQSQSTRP